ncbi:unnamed protein product [Parajaminaea phylloscopi]
MKKFISKLEAKLDSSSGSVPKGAASSAHIPDLNAPPDQARQYRFRQQFGTNLGSWFTLEAWLTGSLFKDVQGCKDSEMDLLQALPPDRARSLLEEHWDNFVNDGDWQWLQSQGINTVRLPISYYHFLAGHPDNSVRSLMEGTEYEKYAEVYTGAWARIERAIKTANQHNIGVLVDLHSAPGAQNTDGHSGLSSGKAGLWSSSRHQKRTVSILAALAKALGTHENVVGLELLNEPKNNGDLQSFYESAIKEIRKSSPDLPLYLGDAWDLNHYSQWVAGQSVAGNFLVVDHHLYRCFTAEDHSTAAGDHAARIHPSKGGPTSSFLREASNKLGGSLIIGEWSAALNPKSLQGRSQGECQAEWAQAQAAAYAAYAGGSFFWTLKKEGPPDAGWCLYSAREQAVLPPGLGRASGANSSSDLDARGQQAGAEKLNDHRNYWNSRGSAGDHQAFADGWSQGWRDSQSFASNGGNIGFYGQWSKERAEAWARQGCDRGQVWEFEHGCAQAINTFNDTLRGRS